MMADEALTWLGTSRALVVEIRIHEVGINALVAGESGVPVSLVSGDDELEHEVHELLGDRVVYVIVKVALGSAAAINYSPTKVQQLLAEGATEAVQRTKAGELKPFTLIKPYRVAFSLRSSYVDSLVRSVDQVIAQWGATKTGARSYTYQTSDARQLVWMLDCIERVVSPLGDRTWGRRRCHSERRLHNGPKDTQERPL